jgi:hypothetical protein
MDGVHDGSFLSCRRLGRGGPSPVGGSCAASTQTAAACRHSRQFIVALMVLEIRSVPTTWAPVNANNASRAHNFAPGHRRTVLRTTCLARRRRTSVGATVALDGRVGVVTRLRSSEQRQARRRPHPR